MAKDWETAWDRACTDTEKFRKSPKSFWEFEIVGAAVFGLGGGYIGFLLMSQNPTLFQQFVYPSIGGAVGIILGFLIVFSCIFLWNLFRAPYRQRNEARQTVDRLEEKREPQLIIEEVKKENYGNVAGFSWGLVVKNKGIDKATKCIGNLIALDFADIIGMSLPGCPLNQPLQWGNIAEFSSDRTDIDGGQKAILQIINRDFVRGVVRVNAQHIAYSRGNDFRETNYLPVSNYSGGNNYLFVIGINSEGKPPIYAICYLRSRTDTCQMKLIEVMNIEPNIKEFRQRSIARIAEIEKQLTSEWYHEIGMDYHDC